MTVFTPPLAEMRFALRGPKVVARVEEGQRVVLGERRREMEGNRTGK